MVYIKSQLSDAIRAAEAATQVVAVKKELAEELAKLDLPQDKNKNQDACFLYLTAIQDSASFVPDAALLQGYLSWLAKNQGGMDSGTRGSFLSIIRNIVGSAAHAMPLRLQFQSFKRMQMADYSDTDPVEATIFQALKDLEVAATEAEVNAVLATIDGIRNLVPVSV